MGNYQLFSSSTTYKINVEYHHFQNKKLININLNELTFSSDAFLCHIITCGMPQFYCTNQINKSRFNEMMYKIYLVINALEADDEGYLTVSDNIKYLDSSEKSFISYSIGMFITKLISGEDKNFAYDYLVHLSIVKKYKKINMSERQEPDLIGFKRNSNEYAIFEAKGRSRQIETGALQNAKAQIKSINCISSLKPTIGIVCVTHPIRAGERIICSMYDPELNTRDMVKIRKEEMIYLYYLPVYELIKERGNGQAQCIIPINNRSYCIRMPESLYDFFSEYDEFSKLTVNVGKKLNEIIQAISKNSVDSGDDLIFFAAVED